MSVIGDAHYRAMAKACVDIANTTASKDVLTADDRDQIKALAALAHANIAIATLR